MIEESSQIEAESLAIRIVFRNPHGKMRNYCMNKSWVVIIFVIAVALIVFFGFHQFTEKNSMKKGTIIILNGPSASGKSSIQKKLTELFQEPYLHIGIDNFFVGVLPQKFIVGPFPENPEHRIMKGIASNDEHGPLFTLMVEPAGQRVIKGMHRAIAAYASQGNNIVVDYILYEKEWLKDLVAVLKDYNVYFIGVDLPLSHLQEREKARGTSPVGHARTHYKTVHEHGIYDLMVDTSEMNAEQAAQKIKEYVENNKEPQAFKKLR